MLHIESKNTIPSKQRFLEYIFRWPMDDIDISDLIFLNLGKTM